jgi:DNA polymerase III epsilon subunit-like protein
MKYVVIDVETTGIDFENCQTLEIGAVIEDTLKILPVEELPKFKCIINHQKYSGSAFAINMNARIFDIIANKSKHQENNVVFPEQVTEMFFTWIQREYFGLNAKDSHYTQGMDFEEAINIGGKNFGVFDKLFLDKIPKWTEKIKCHRRFIDPAILFVDWKNDSTIPDLNTCLSRAGIKKEVSHNALEDAIDTLMCLRARY